MPNQGVFKTGLILIVLAFCLSPFTNCASGFEDEAGVAAGDSALDCLNNPDCDNLSLLQLNISHVSPYKIPAGNESICIRNNGNVTAQMACVDIGGACNVVNFPGNRIYWELTLEDGTAVTDSTTMEEYSSPSLLAHGECINGFYNIRVTFPTTTINQNHRLRVFLVAEDEEGQRHEGTSGLHEASIVITP